MALTIAIYRQYIDPLLLLSSHTIQVPGGVLPVLLLLVCVSSTITGQPKAASSSAECSRDKPPFSFVREQDSTMWDIVWVSPQGHRSMSVSRHFLLQAPQCPCSVRKRFSDHCCQGRSKPGCRIVRSHIRWELTTWADFQCYWSAKTRCIHPTERALSLCSAKPHVVCWTVSYNRWKTVQPDPL